ncbi:hypothetical protein N7493_007310 [Penicillium malachiteum]|uniref:Uncharacterized protein n=1 Tax=Penicillium malachiteum TaxID=1324776 RepID=A0AAD6HJD0_9EURO|nr:hypothetical protein N7493_007310 [Penicillium malachiteum]
MKHSIELLGGRALRIPSKFSLPIIRCVMPVSNSESHYAFRIWRQVDKASLHLTVNAGDIEIKQLMLAQHAKLQKGFGKCNSREDGPAVLKEIQQSERHNKEEFSKLVKAQTEKKRQQKSEPTSEDEDHTESTEGQTYSESMDERLFSEGETESDSTDRAQESKNGDSNDESRMGTSYTFERMANLKIILMRKPKRRRLNKR